MIPLRKAINASVTRKFLMALTGLGLTLFLVIHLAGNLSLYQPEGATFNLYSHKLAALGPLLYALEILLLLAAIVHVVVAAGLTRGYRKARPQRYAAWKSKGSQQSNLSSRNMIITGAVILGFLVFHINHFKFGAGINEGYVMTVDGQQVRDLYRLVMETFKSPFYSAFYIAVMLFIGFHVRHGFWSAFQSLGMMSRRFSRGIYLLGATIAALVAAGFLMIPIYIYFIR